MSKLVHIFSIGPDQGSDKVFFHLPTEKDLPLQIQEMQKRYKAQALFDQSLLPPITVFNGLECTPSQVLNYIHWQSAPKKPEEWKIRSIAYQKAAEKGEYLKSDLEEINICWRKMFEALINMAKLLSCDLFLSDLINYLDKKGITARFPQETTILLEAAVVNQKGMDGKLRFEFFDAYYAFQKQRGALLQIATFIQANLNVLIMLDLHYSRAFSDLLKQQGIQGDNLRLELLKKAYEEKKSFGQYDTPYKIAYELAWGYLLRGNYRQAKKIRHETTGKNSIDWDFFDRNFHRLAPNFPYTSFTPFKRADTNKSIEQASVATREATAVVTIASYDYSTQSPHQIVEKIVELFKNPAIMWDTFYQLCSVFLNHLLIHRREKAIEVFELLLAQEKKDSEFKLPFEIQQIIQSHLFAFYYRQGEYKRLVEIGEALQSLSRAALYYYVKAAFNEGQSQEDQLQTGRAQEKQTREGRPYEGQPFSVQTKALERLLSNFDKFSNTEWEFELWQNFILPHYDWIADTLHHNIQPRKALELTDKAITEAATPHNLAVALKILVVGHLKGSYHKYCAALVAKANETGESINVELISKVADEAAVYASSRDACIIIKLVSEYSRIPLLKEKLCDFLLNQDTISRSAYDEALVLIGDDAALYAKYVDKLEVAEKKLKILRHKKILFDEYIKMLFDSEIWKNIFNNKHEPIIVLMFFFGKMRELVTFYGEFLAQINTVKLTSCYNKEIPTAESGTLSLLSISSLRIIPCSNHLFRIQCNLQTDSDQTEQRKFEVLFDRHWEMVQKSDAPPEQRANTNLLTKILEAAILEAICNFIQEEDNNVTKNILIEFEKALEEFQDQFATYMPNADQAQKIDGLEGIGVKNKKIIDRLAAEFSHLQKTPNVPSHEEVCSLIAYYIELITETRDLDQPITSYAATIDENNPLSSFVKFLRIYNVEVADKILAERKISFDKLPYKLPSESNKNNFFGYYELSCYFEEDDWQPILGLFLDEKGVLHIPGLMPDHPLYHQLWLVVIESLVTKVVPEMKPYRHIFLKQQEKLSAKSLLPKAPIAEKESIPATRRRLCFNALLFSRKKEETSTSIVEQKLKFLGALTEIDRSIYLMDTDISEWPICYKDGREYVTATGLIFKSEDKNFIDISVFRQFLDITLLPEMYRTEACIPFDKVSPECKKTLFSQLTIKIGAGRAYRMPVKIREPQGSIEVIDGKSYELKLQKQKPKHALKRDGKWYKLLPLGVYTPIEITTLSGTKIFFAVPFIMTDDMRDIYAKTSRVNISFAPQQMVYSIEYEKQTGDIISYNFVGSGAKDDKGNYIDPMIRSFHTLIQKDNSEADKPTAQTLFEVTTNIGYRQGIFRNLGKYLQIHGTIPSRIAKNLLIDLMKTYLSEDDLRIWEKQLENLEQQKEMSQKKPCDTFSKTKVARKRQKAIDALFLPGTAYVINESGDSRRNYSGLYGEDLFVIDESDDRYRHLCNIYREDFNPKEEIFVLIGARPAEGNKSSVAIAKNALMEPKKQRLAKVEKSLLIKKSKNSYNISFSQQSEKFSF